MHVVGAWTTTSVAPSLSTQAMRNAAGECHGVVRQGRRLGRAFPLEARGEPGRASGRERFAFREGAAPAFSSTTTVASTTRRALMEASTAHARAALRHEADVEAKTPSVILVGPCVHDLQSKKQKPSSCRLSSGPSSTLTPWTAPPQLRMTSSTTAVHGTPFVAPSAVHWYCVPCQEPVAAAENVSKLGASAVVRTAMVQSSCSVRHCTCGSMAVHYSVCSRSVFAANECQSALASAHCNGR